MAVSGSFRGFGKGAIVFFEELAAHNSREWWLANKKRYEAEIREPLELLLTDLEREFGEAKVFRPNRDTRFSKDKTPYKTSAAAVIHAATGGLYVSLSSEGIWAGGGGYILARDQLARFREAVDDERSAKKLERVLADLRRRKADVGGHSELKTAPRGYAADHPRIELLRLDGITAGWLFPPRAWFHTAQAETKVADSWRAVRPLNEWLQEHVGPTSSPNRH
jgi:uncharacterized protein (TIGR02453 family)